MEVSAGPPRALSPRPGDKETLRRRLLAERAAGCAGGDAAAAADTTFADTVLALPELGSARTVAAYTALRGEPPTAALLQGLHRRGVRVLLPVLRPDADLDWADWVGGSDWVGGADWRADPDQPDRPSGTRQGPATIRAADLVVVPGLAAGADGTRLGRGGGSYDRALTRLRVGVPVVLLLWDGELLPDVPREPHDRRVDLVVTPTRVHRFPPRR
jgi:5-formyltetrahydrofolate cyclo-ligase